jgi:hypothetical protein
MEVLCPKFGKIRLLWNGVFSERCSVGKYGQVHISVENVKIKNGDSRSKNWEEIIIISLTLCSIVILF